MLSTHEPADRPTSRLAIGGWAFAIGSGILWLTSAVLVSVDSTTTMPEAIVTAALALAVTASICAVKLLVAANLREAGRRVADEVKAHIDIQVAEIRQAIKAVENQRRQHANPRRRGNTPRQRETEPFAGDIDQRVKDYMAGIYDRELGD